MLLPLLLFILSAILLYLSSHALINNFTKVFYRLTKSHHTAVNLLFFLVLPGVFLHEFSHIITAEILQVRTGELSLKPQFSDGQLKLGSAQIALTDPIRLTLIGTAPFLIGTTSLWLLLTFGFKLDLSTINLSIFKSLSQTPWHLTLLFGYLTFTLSNTMFSSPSDLQAAGLPIVLFLLITGSFYLTDFALPQTLITYSSNLFTLLATIFSLTLVFNLLFLFPLKLFNK